MTERNNVGRKLHTLVIHGGAGVVLSRISPERRSGYAKSLGAIVDTAFACLDKGGSALEAVTVAVALLEDDPIFNAGQGAALNRDAVAELDASIMDGANARAGAVAGITRVKNPVKLARAVMEHSPHVFLISAGAEEYAVERGLEIVPNTWFITDERRAQLLEEQSGARGGDCAPPMGTVGAVACDRKGNLAAATSTGGTTNKRPGRIGDTPMIGAGTYASNGSCAVSCTGEGEFFIRTVAAYRVAALLEGGNHSLEKAVQAVIRGAISDMGGLGGLIAVDPAGQAVWDFNTQGMLRAVRNSSGRRTIGIGRAAEP